MLSYELVTASSLQIYLFLRVTIGCSCGKSLSLVINLHHLPDLNNPTTNPFLFQSAIRFKTSSHYQSSNLLFEYPAKFRELYLQYSIQ